MMKLLVFLALSKSAFGHENVVLVPGESIRIRYTTVSCVRPTGELSYSYMDQGCFDTLLNTTPGSPTVATALKWAAQCRSKPVTSPGCTTIETATPEECFSSIYRYAGQNPSAGLVLEIQKACVAVTMICK